MFTFVVVCNVGQKLAGSSNTDPLSVPQLIETALLAQHTLPVGTISCTTSHST